ncbi:MAG: hypothetical protein U0167_14265 [bacterium]
MKERERHRLAFERYVAMGQGRSLTRLAAEMEVSESAVKQWSRELQWAERLEARSREVAQALATESVRNDVDERKSDEQMVRLGLVQIAKALVEGRIKPTIADLDRMIRLRRELAEDPTAREKLVFRVTWPGAPQELDENEPTSVEQAREDLRREVDRLEGKPDGELGPTGTGGAPK